MKSFLYVGAALMIGASIYGFVDYKKSSRSRELGTMYSSPQTKDPATSREESEKKERLLSEDDITKKYPEVIETNEATIANTAAVKESSEKKNKKSKKKKFNYKLFSRAPLEDRYLEKTVKVEEPKKTETTKTEKKEQ